MQKTRPKDISEILKKLKVVSEKKVAIGLEDLANEMNLSSEETLIFLRQVFSAKNGPEIYTEQGKYMVGLNTESFYYKLPLTHLEWLELYSILDTVHQDKFQSSEGLQLIKKRVTENGPMSVIMELLNQIEDERQVLTDHQQSFLMELDEAIIQRKLVVLKTLGDKNYCVFPCRVIHLEGRLTMIAEDVSDRCLVVIPVNELAEISTDERSLLIPQSSAFEIDEFIVALRSMNEKEVRLILKIHEPQSVNLFPKHHFLGRPCMVTNPNGDLIWAAYVEPGVDLFEWLIGLQNKVEILDPVKFKDEYLMYCEEKLRKSA